MPILNSRKKSGIPDVRSPNLHLAAARRKEFATHPRVAGNGWNGGVRRDPALQTAHRAVRGTAREYFPGC
jgi:hypothetical protein